MIVTALAEKTVVNHMVNIQLIEKGVSVLKELNNLSRQSDGLLTLETEAVKTTTS
jgi:hypothetical protein